MEDITLVCDNYKVNKVKKLLFDRNIDFTTKHSNRTHINTTLFIIKSTTEIVAEIATIINQHFKEDE